MNADILKGTWLEIKGRVKEKWGKLTDNYLGEIEGKEPKTFQVFYRRNMDISGINASWNMKIASNWQILSAAYVK